MNPEKKYILSIESSGKVCGIALLSFENNRLNFENNNFENNNILTNFELLSKYNIYVGNKHDRFLAELCHRILNDNDLRVDDLSGVAVSIGPGSFTGLRIGSALAKGLCFTVDEENEVDEKNEENKTHSIKLIAVPTLKALAYRVSEFLKSVNYFENNIDNNIKNNKHNYQILSVILSHNNLIYEQLFDEQNNNLTEILLTKIEDVENKYAKNERLFLSTNYKIDIDCGLYLPEFYQISASTVGKLAIQMYNNNEFTDPEKLVPLYMQEFIPK